MKALSSPAHWVLLTLLLSLSQVQVHGQGIPSPVIGSEAPFGYPQGIAVDIRGNVYVADSSNHTILKVTSAGSVTIFAGAEGQRGSANGKTSAARFNAPCGLAVDRLGNLYVTENETIRRITFDGMVTTLAGAPGLSGDVDGTGGSARFNNPLGVAVDETGNLYVADAFNNTLRKVTAGGVVTTMSQRRVTFDSLFVRGRISTFQHPEGVAVDAKGNVFVSDSTTIKKVTPAGAITTLVGQAELKSMGPCGLALGTGGELFGADTQFNTIRRVTLNGEVTIVAGGVDKFGSVDGPGEVARFFQPYGIAADRFGNLFVAERVNGTIRKMTHSGSHWNVTTLAGRPQFARRKITN